MVRHLGCTMSVCTFFFRPSFPPTFPLIFLSVVSFDFSTASPSRLHFLNHTAHMLPCPFYSSSNTSKTIPRMASYRAELDKHVMILEETIKDATLTVELVTYVLYLYIFLSLCVCNLESFKRFVPVGCVFDIFLFLFLSRSCLLDCFFLFFLPSLCTRSQRHECRVQGGLSSSLDQVGSGRGPLKISLTGRNHI
jgi:hypothetical protein